MNCRARIVVVLVLIVAVLWAAGKAAVLYADYLWFDSLGYASVFTTTLWAKVLLGASVLVLTLAWLGVNMYVAGRLSPGRYIQIKGLRWQIPSPSLKQTLRWVAIGVIVLMALGLAQAAAGYWYGALQFLNRPSAAWTEPVLGRDAGFYIFVLPILAAIKTYGLIMAVSGLVLVAATYFIGGAIAWPGDPLTRPAGIHLGILGLVFGVVLAFGYWLDQFDLLLASHGAVFGAGYTDVHIRIPALRAMTVVCVIAGILLLAAGVRRQKRILVLAVSLIALFHIIGLWTYPSFVQRFQVEPNELEKESQYIENNIKATRNAYDLANIEEKPFAGTGALTLKDIQNVPGTLDNVRIWDWRVLLSVYNQLQALQPYYHFNDVDIDRYTVDSRYRQVTLAVRELQTSQVNAKSRTWVNLHLMYTHGDGLVMSPVNAVTPEGMPDLWVRDIPPRTQLPAPTSWTAPAPPGFDMSICRYPGPPNPSGLDIRQPDIYFGELTNEEVYVDTKQEAPDAAAGAPIREAPYEGTGGVRINTFWRKLLFAYYFSDWNVLMTDSFTAETRVLWRRTVADRVRRLAPVLDFDGDPYPVIHDGRIVWMVDGYTKTDQFPYSTRVRTGTHGEINYIRNSVKAVVDAYDGSVTFYVFEEQDPLILAARAALPKLFRDKKDMPEDLRRHVRYPDDLFEIQAEQFLTYHMTDPQTFYKKEKLWQWPKHVFEGQTQPMAAYYIIMTLPGHPSPEYILILPFTAAGKENMVGWMAGRCDGQEYGKLLVYTFPEGQIVFGPNQVEALIDQDARISPQLTLWNQQGSRVVRGNLLVIPVDQSILYVQPLYLKAEKAAIPKLTRIIVAYQDRIAMEDTLEKALAAVFGQAPPSAAHPAPPPVKPEPTAPLQKRALELWKRGLDEMKAGKWAEFGETQKQLTDVLEEMNREAPPK